MLQVGTNGLIGAYAVHPATAECSKDGDTVFSIHHVKDTTNSPGCATLSPAQVTCLKFPLEHVQYVILTDSFGFHRSLGYINLLLNNVLLFQLSNLKYFFRT